MVDAHRQIGWDGGTIWALDLERWCAAKQLIGRYLPSAKNGMVADHYGKLGFKHNCALALSETCFIVFGTHGKNDSARSIFLGRPVELPGRLLLPPILAQL